MYAIQHRKTGKFVFGTNFCHNPPHNRTSNNQMQTYDKLAYAKYDFIKRQCGKDYCIVKLKPIEVERTIPFSGRLEDIKREDYEET